MVSIDHDGAFNQTTFVLLWSRANIAIPAANFCWIVAGVAMSDVIAMGACMRPV